MGRHTKVHERKENEMALVSNTGPMEQSVGEILRMIKWMVLLSVLRKRNSFCVENSPMIN